MSPYNTAVTLQGRWARLEPLTLEHAPALFRAAQDDDIWRHMPVPTPTREDDVRGMKYIGSARNRMPTALRSS